MALENRIDALKKKHADIDHQLQQEQLSPGANEQALQRLKIIKLGLKDEIERLLQAPRAIA